MLKLKNTPGFSRNNLVMVAPHLTVVSQTASAISGWSFCLGGRPGAWVEPKPVEAPGSSGAPAWSNSDLSSPLLSLASAPATSAARLWERAGEDCGDTSRNCRHSLPDTYPRSAPLPYGPAHAPGAPEAPERSGRWR